MSESFSIYESPFSDETKVLRRNSLLSSGICLFIGITGELPTKFALLGVSFSATQQDLIGWFILAVSAYFYLHFVSIAAVEVAKWIHPFYTRVMTKKILLKEYSHAFDESDFHDIPPEINEQDKNDMGAHAKTDADWRVSKKLNWLYSLIYLRLTIEILVPVAIGIWAMVKMIVLITSKSTGT